MSRWIAVLRELRSRISVRIVLSVENEIKRNSDASVAALKSCLPFLRVLTQTGRNRMSAYPRLVSTVPTALRHQDFTFRRNYSRHTTTSGLTETLNPTESAKRKAGGKSVEPEKILLMSETENVSVTTLPDAEKLAKKKGFQLVEVIEVESKLHTDKKVFKFQTQAQHFGDDWKNKHVSTTSSSSPAGDKKERKKEDKTVLFKSKITVHDIEAKVKQMNKLLEKGHPIRVFIGGAGSTGDPEFVFRGIQNNLTRSAKIQQKKSTPTDIRFQILPVIVDAEDTATPASATQKSKGAKLKEQHQEPPPSSGSE